MINDDKTKDLLDWYEPNDKCKHKLKQDSSHYETYECIKCHKRFIKNTPVRIIGNHFMKGLLRK